MEFVSHDGNTLNWHHDIDSSENEAEQTDAGNVVHGICRVIDDTRSSSTDLKSPPNLKRHP